MLYVKAILKQFELNVEMTLNLNVVKLAWSLKHLTNTFRSLNNENNSKNNVANFFIFFFKGVSATPAK